VAINQKNTKYQQVEEYLISTIAENNYPPGTLLPSEPSLCQRFDISRNTVRQAIGNLINQGLIYNEHGRGTFVAPPQGPQKNLSTHHEIGIVLKNIEQLQHPFFSEYIRGIQEEFSLHECAVHLIFSSQSPEEKIDLSRENEVLGLILISGEVNDQYILSLQAKRIPFVWFPSYRTSKKVPYIYLNKDRGLYLAVEHLVKLGHQNIAYIAGDPVNDSRDYEEKLKGFQSAMKGFQISIKKGWIKNGFYTREGAEEVIQSFYSGNSGPTAIVTANDIMAIASINALKSRGKNIPEDVSVVGFDDITEASNTIPSLTTVHVPMGKMGREAAKILFDMIEKNDTTMIYQVNVEPELKFRGTTAPPKNKRNGKLIKTYINN
jgi:GntR family transcriptional regulator, arabinose operon transcriptional repressor